MTLRTIYLVMSAHQLVNGQLELLLKEFDLTPSLYAVLRRLEVGGISAVEIARAARVSAQAVTQWIHQLEAKGLITRSVDPNNRRLLRIKLTRTGHRRLADCDAAVDKLEDRLLAEFPEADLETFRALLERLSPRARTAAPAWARRRHRVGVEEAVD